MNAQKTSPPTRDAARALGRPSLRAVAIAITIALSGCKAAAAPRHPDTDDQAWPNADRSQESAASYCRRVAINADAYAQTQLGVGIALAAVAGGGTIVGTAMGPGRGSDPNWAEENRNALVLGASALVGAVASTILVLSRNSSNVSEAATLAMMERDEEMKMRLCLAARAQLAAGRANATGALMDRLETVPSGDPADGKSDQSNPPTALTNDRATASPTPPPSPDNETEPTTTPAEDAEEPQVREGLSLLPRQQPPEG
ncbi:MAG: hypothetical protein AAF799_44475 [Myxococcota bacterium]